MTWVARCVKVNTNSWWCSVSVYEWPSWGCRLFLSMYLNTCCALQSLSLWQRKRLSLITVTQATFQSVSLATAASLNHGSNSLFSYVQLNLLSCAVDTRTRKRRKRTTWTSTTKNRCLKTLLAVQIWVLLSELTKRWQHCVTSPSHKHQTEPISYNDVASHRFKIGEKIYCFLKMCFYLLFLHLH